jgi:hypothetical protein
MKKSIVPLVLMGICLVSLIAGFVLGQLTFLAVNQGVQIETKSMRIIVAFKPEASDLMKDIGVASLRFYSEVLTVCINEPDNLEKVNSIKILGDFVAGSCLVNALRPRIKEKKEKSDEKGSGEKRSL